eukprot:6577353-Pyramimonas_sp.AAC.2
MALLVGTCPLPREDIPSSTVDMVRLRTQVLSSPCMVDNTTVTRTYGQQYQQSYAPQASAASAGDASAWQALQDGEGRTYYYNSQTGVSQWEKPEGMP